jgi:hypothetical protein
MFAGGGQESATCAILRKKLYQVRASSKEYSAPMSRPGPVVCHSTEVRIKQDGGLTTICYAELLTFELLMQWFPKWAVPTPRGCGITLRG